MDRDDPLSRELRSARDRIAELQRRSGAPGPGPGLLPEALAELDTAIEELSVTGEELRSQTDELHATAWPWRPSATATRSCSSRRRSPTWSPTSSRPGSARPTGRRWRCWA
jgi:hypothetical protein